MNSTNQSNLTRSVYIIGHGCNDIKTVNKAFRQKVNGIECDLWADDEKKWWVSHDGSEKTELVEWLGEIGRAEKKFGRQMALIVFDIKSAEPFLEIRNIINTHLPASLPRIYSTAKLDKAHIFKDIVPVLEVHECIAIDEEDDAAQVAEFFRSVKAKQCWYGNGITLIPLNEEFHESMRQASKMRGPDAPFARIYTWSVHRKEAIRKYLEEDEVDAVLVGLNNFFTRPVTSALNIIKANKQLNLADRNTPLF